MSIMKLRTLLDKKKTKFNEPLAPYTTLKVGGPADIFYTADSTEDLIKVVKLAKENNVPVTLLGAGSNVLVSDDGIRGLVVRVKSDNIRILDVQSEIKPEIRSRIKPGTKSEKTDARLEQPGKKDYYDFDTLEYDESDSPIVH
ncbi:MAG TPA: FAD-binding protein [bacterium]|nr:FAD-binding protein [bacterium]